MARSGGAPRASGPHGTSGAVLFVKHYFNHGLPSWVRDWFPIAALFALRARHHLLGPINEKLAGIKRLRVMGLPAGILPHGPRQRDLIVLVTTHQAITRHIRPIDEMDRGEQDLVGQPVMNRLHYGHVLVGR